MESLGTPEKPGPFRGLDPETPIITLRVTLQSVDGVSALSLGCWRRPRLDRRVISVLPVQAHECARDLLYLVSWLSPELSAAIAMIRPRM